MIATIGCIDCYQYAPLLSQAVFSEISEGAQLSLVPDVTSRLAPRSTSRSSSASHQQSAGHVITLLACANARQCNNTQLQMGALRTVWSKEQVRVMIRFRIGSRVRLRVTV